MTPATFKTIRQRAGLSQSGLAALLRIGSIKTIQRWEVGEVPISGPASIVVEMLDAGEIPARYLTDAKS